MTRAFAILALLFLCGCPSEEPVDPSADGGGEPDAGWRSALYPAEWRPDIAPDDAGRFLHDFSYAGYRRAEAPLPGGVPGPVFSVSADPDAGDATARIQQAIDDASAADGGTVALSAGLFRVDGKLFVRRSGIELRGAGSAETKVFFTSATGMTDEENLSFRGETSFGAEHALAQDGEARSAVVFVADASGLAPGTLVAVGAVITDAFVAEHGMTGTWTSFNGQWRPFFRREVVAVDTTTSPNRVTLDIPLRYRMKTRDAASVRVEPGRLREIGVRGLSVSTAVSWDAAWSADRSHAIGFRNVTDGWVVDVTTFANPDATGFSLQPVVDWHLQSGGLYLLDSSRITVKDSRFGRAQNRGSGGNGYLVELSRTSDALLADVVAVDGRHNFIQNWDFGTSGNVFLRCHSAGGKNVSLYFGPQSPIELPAPSEFHHSLAMANLIDSCTLDDGWKAVNRGAQSSGAGHTSTENVFWRVKGVGTLTSQQFGHGYVIGTEGLTVEYRLTTKDSEASAPRDWVEALDAGAAVTPASLYEDQLGRRTGKTP